MRATTINDESLNYGELQYINANNSQIVFLTVGCITMVAIAQKEKKRLTEKMKNEKKETEMKGGENISQSQRGYS